LFSRDLLEKDKYGIEKVMFLCLKSLSSGDNEGHSETNKR